MLFVSVLRLSFDSCTMPSILDACDKYFGTRDVYGLFHLEKDCEEKQSESGETFLNRITQFPFLASSFKPLYPFSRP